MANVRYYRFDALLLQQGWLRPGYSGVDPEGRITFLSDRAPSDSIAIESIPGIALPGFLNAHSHAFQYGMAGLAEKHVAGTTDDFWSWREAMYECALAMDPDQMEAIATMLYTEMLRKGYTHVAEFHYLHHDRNGRHFANMAENGERLLAAAQKAGIKITLVPIFYQKGGFGRDPEPRQRRFICKTIDEYFKLLEASRSAVQKYSDASLGFGVHSLRAVSTADVLLTFENGPKDLPFHLHAAEQIREVEDCLGFLGLRPVAWLLENLPLKERFNLVHCTHLDDDELKRLAQSGAQVILCPGTEANLGDGVFRLRDFAGHYGSWCIGTDSQVSLNPLEDLRWLDYAQRLISHRRNTFDDAASVLLNKAVSGGRKAMGRFDDLNFFAPGKPFDAVIYRSSSPLLNTARMEHLLSIILYTADTSDILGTMVNGKWIVHEDRLINGAAIRTNFDKAICELNQ